MITPIQRILFGSPGTGKSHRIYNDNTEDGGIIKKELRIEAPENIIKAVFHPEYTHGDFMGKLLPITTRDGKVKYTFYEGHFLKALSQSYKNLITKKYKNQQETEHVALVIDEINRGNSSSIFGNVFQLLDRKYKGENIGWSEYDININEVVFSKILELIGIKYYDESKKYELNPYINPMPFDQFKEKISFLKIDLEDKKISIPYNLSIIATMNTSDSSIYYMDSAFKRRWEWEFIDIDSQPVKQDGIAFSNRDEWKKFVEKLNSLIRSNHKYIRGIEDKQIGYWFIKDNEITKATIQNKLMFFIWDSVFSRDKKPLIKLLYGDEAKDQEKLVTFGDFAKEVNLFINKINHWHV